MTPLLEALKAEKIARRDANAIIRNHPHYKDILTVSNPPSSSLKKTTRAEATTVKKMKKEPAVTPSSSKPVQQNQTKLSLNSSHAVGNTVSSPLVKPTPPVSIRSSRNRHAAKASKEAVQQGALPTTTAAPSALLAPEEATSNAAVLTKRGRLGLGLRHFEAALSGVGVTTGEQKRGEKSKDAFTPMASSTAAGPDANSAGMLAAPVAPHGEGGRGGRRGGGGRGKGRGGQGPSRIG